jgi:tRNA-specific 2-thiouridylase
VGEPLYVVRLEAERARVVVGPREALATRAIRIADVNWLGDRPLSEIGGEGIEIAVRVRSTREPRPALLRLTEGRVEVELLAPEDGVSPGQACVIYDTASPRARVLGGGTIVRADAGAARDLAPAA